MAIPLSYHASVDQQVWPHTSNGCYSVKSGYHLCCLTGNPLQSVHPHTSFQVDYTVLKWIWGFCATPKVKHFIWKAVSNALATGDNRHLYVTHNRRLLNILFSRALQPQKHAWIHQLITDWQSEPFNSSKFTEVAYLLWQLWKHRCDCIFHRKPPDPFVVVSRATAAAYEFSEANHKLSRIDNGTTSSLSLQLWEPPPPGIIKINADASWHLESLGGGIAALFRDSSGLLLHGVTKYVCTSSPLLAEALAFREALLHAHDLSLTDIIITSDSQGLIHAFSHSSHHSHWSIAPIVSDIRILADSFSNLNWSWTSRKANVAADHIATLTYRRVCPPTWVSQLPPSLQLILLSDVTSTEP
ncbi:uncharacterized protein LOC133737852 [Rosa rugosa]|uniref:uncharacterized protein LOC133737852 n=1 Tax=Rosa rugosa TaxID=74645 RepID=UPI002B415D5F|nr:uncharacterized protein LOC133737852 [Rosa rugosa]